MLATAESVRDDLLWAGFAVCVATIALLPAAIARDYRRMPPAPLLALAALPVLGRALATVPVTGAIATYLSVAAIALLVVTELHVFTTVEMTPAFAVAVTVLGTAATAGVWAIVRWGVDGAFGTALLVSETALMWEFVYSTIAGIGAGLVFGAYVRRHVERGVPP